MEEDFVTVAKYIDEAINLTLFILSKLEGGAKAPLKVWNWTLNADYSSTLLPIIIWYNML